MTKFGYNVVINQSLESEYEPDEEFGSWERSYSNWFEKISKTKDVPDVVSDFDIQKGETCYVVWVEYNSGDSFGTAENENVDNGDLTSKQAGSVGGQMVKKMVESYENSLKTNG